VGSAVTREETDQQHANLLIRATQRFGLIAHPSDPLDPKCGAYHRTSGQADRWDNFRQSMASSWYAVSIGLVDRTSGFMVGLSADCRTHRLQAVGGFVNI
jgi:hypothetical protein